MPDAELDVANELKEIKSLLDSARPNDAEQRLRSLLARMDDGRLRSHANDVRAVIDAFLPKRRKELLAVLNQRESVITTGAIPTNPGDGLVVSGRWESFQKDLAACLNDLSDRHIFQWATSYRDAVRWTHEQATESLRAGMRLTDVEAVLRVEYRRHSKEIFEKGYSYVTLATGVVDATLKSVNGLQRLIDLFIEAYSLLVADSTAYEARSLRTLTSVLIEAVLEGYCLASFGSNLGASFLTRYPRLWLHSLGFLTKQGLGRVLQCLPVGALRQDLGQSLLPVLESIDRIAQSDGFAPRGLPKLVEASDVPMRLEIRLDLPPSTHGRQYLTLHVYLGASPAIPGSFEHLTQRGQVLAVGPFARAESGMGDFNDTDDDFVVDTTSLDRNSVQSVQRIFECLHRLLSQAAGQRIGAPFTYNVARDFPLKNPRQQRYFHVYRDSVQRLLQGFEGRSGVRLWCSVRRSGKTTACFDLAAATNSQIVVRQTCDDSEVYPGAGRFYEMFEQVIRGGSRIPPTFFRDAVKACATEEIRGDARVVFALDEYETLFDRMRDIAAGNPPTRRTLVQPLLNQMAGFARDNLLILIGQRPEAHFIIMDQNQLSPYVEQDPFPLFEHQSGSVRSEFCTLLSQILTESVRFSRTFADEVYLETQGHPYLTVNLMVHFVDWLIANRRPRTPVEVKEKDFADFAQAELRPSVLSLRPEYDTFLRIVGEALGDLTRRDAPWLHCVHLVLRQSAEEGKLIPITLDRVDTILAGLISAGSQMVSRNEFLRTAQLANFLTVHDDRVRARIPLLARLCVAAHSSTKW
jgi:hypothetical protein